MSYNQPKQPIIQYISRIFSNSVHQAQHPLYVGRKRSSSFTESCQCEFWENGSIYLENRTLDARSRWDQNQFKIKNARNSWLGRGTHMSEVLKMDAHERGPTNGPT